MKILYEDGKERQHGNAAYFKDKVRMNFFIKIYKLVIILIMIVFPILSVLNCTNWSEATGNASNCYINSAFLKEYASLTGGLIFISVWTYFIPLALYVGLCMFMLFAVPRYLKHGFYTVKSPNGEIIRYESGEPVYTNKNTESFSLNKIDAELHEAVISNDIEAVLRCLEGGANPASNNQLGYSAIDYARGRGYKNILFALEGYNKTLKEEESI